MKRRSFVPFAATLFAFVVPALIATWPSPSSTAAEVSLPPFVHSPPVFVLRGSSVPVTVIAAGRPDRVSVLIGGRRVALSRARDRSTWSGRLTASRATTYYAVARYGSEQVRSAPYALSVVRSLVKVKPRLSTLTGVRLARVPLRSELGVDEGAQAARILPASFAVDADAREIDVLDTVDARVATYGFGGASLRSQPIATGSRTVTDMVRGPDGTRYLLDPVREELLRQSRDTTEVFAHARVPNANTRMALRGPDLSVREPAQGRLLRLFDTQRRQMASNGATTPDDASVAVSGTSVLAARGSRAVRIDLSRPVLDVLDYGTDGDGSLWALADVAVGDTARTVLVTIDILRPQRVRAANVDASVFGDVTRRLVTLDDGVVVMSGTADALTFTRYVSGAAS